MIPPWRLVFALACPGLLSSCAGPAPVVPAPATPASPSTAPSVAPSPPPQAPSSLAPTPAASVAPNWRQGEVVAFAAPLRPGTPGDLFVYSARLGAVVPLVAANSEADEARPMLSGDRRWLVFQRTARQAGGKSRAEVLLLDTFTDHLARIGVTSADTDKRAPAISQDGRWVAYVAAGKSAAQLKVYDMYAGTEHPIPTANTSFTVIDSPSFSDDGTCLAFSAAGSTTKGRDLFLFDRPSGTMWTLPFANSRYHEDNPVISRDGQRLLFDSDRSGSRNIYEAELATGKLNSLASLNSDRFDEVQPQFHGRDRSLIRFKRYTAPAAEPDRYILQVYDPATAKVDTLPLASSPAP